MSQLHKLRVLNTRPKMQAASLTQQLSSTGIQVVELPLLEIQPYLSYSLNSLQLASFDYAIFISPNAVHYFFDQHVVKQWPDTLHTIALGQGTSQVLEQYQIQAHSVPQTFNSAGILALPILQNVHQKSILLIKGAGGLPDIEQVLMQRGADITSLAVYQRAKIPISSEINDLYCNDALDMIIITSQEALDSLFSQLNQQQREWLCNKTFLVISTRIEKKAAQYGIKTIFVCEIHALLKTIEAIYDNRAVSSQKK